MGKITILFEDWHLLLKGNSAQAFSEKVIFLLTGRIGWAFNENLPNCLQKV